MKCPVCGSEMDRTKKNWICECEEHQDPIIIPLEAQNPLPDYVKDLPTPVSIPLVDYWSETNPYIKLYRLCDAAEMITRFFAVVLLSDLKYQLGDFPDDLKQTLCENISRPTFGQWVAIVRKAVQSIDKNRLIPFVSSLKDFWNQTWEPLLSGQSPAGNGVIQLRNFLAHSGRIPNQEAIRLLDVHRTGFESAAERLQFLADFMLIATRKGMERPFALKGHSPDNINQPVDDIYAHVMADLPLIAEQVYLAKSSGESSLLNLFPLHSYNKILNFSLDQDESAGDRHAPMLYFRYNQNQERFEFTSLAEDCSFSQAGDDYAPLFFEVFDIKNWREKLEQKDKNIGSDAKSWPQPEWKFRFTDVTNELAPGIVGREEQIEEVKDWLRRSETNEKILWISGKPGVGKSAFMAKLCQDLKTECGKARICLIPFFFRAGDSRCSTESFYQASSYYLATAYGVKPDKNSKDSHKARFERLIEHILHEQVREDYLPVIFLIDGLDELTGPQVHLLDLPLDLRLPNTRWLLSGRNEGSLDAKYTAKPKTEILWPHGELPALTPDNIREIISLELPANKYDLFKLDLEAKPGEFQNPFIEQLIGKSEGLPIYIQLVIEDIKNGEIGIQINSKLPDKLAGYYDTLLDRLKTADDVLMQLNYILGILCWSREPLSKQDLIGILRPVYEQTRTSGWQASFEKALGLGNIILKLSTNSAGESGWTLYHQSLRQHLRTSSRTEHMRNNGLIILLNWARGWNLYEADASAYNYALRYFPAHLLDYYLIDPNFDQADAILEELTALITNDGFIDRKVVKAGLVQETIEDFSETLDQVLKTMLMTGRKRESRDLAVKLLGYSFSSVEQTELREILQEIWFEYASDIIADFCLDNVFIGQEFLDLLFRSRERDLKLVRLSLRAAELGSNSEFLVKALEYESGQGAGGKEEEYDPEADDGLTGVNRWVVDALFLVARKDIKDGQWERFEGLVENLIGSLERVLMAGQSKWKLALNAALQRKRITVHLKSVFEVVYKIFINYPQDQEVLQRLGKMGSSLGGIIYDMPVKELVRIPGLDSLIYSLVSLKWNSVTENGTRRKPIEEIFTVSSQRQIKATEDFVNLILLARYENRDAERVFPGLVELAFCSGLVSTSDEMYQVNRAIHGHVLYHMCKFFPDEFENQYVRRYFLNKEVGAEGLASNFKEPIRQYYPDRALKDMGEGSRGLYEMLARFLTYEAVSTDDPEHLLVLNEELVRYIIDHDLELFGYDYNIVGRPLHILTAVTIVEARTEREGLPPTVKIIQELASGQLASSATEAQRWEAISKCYFDLFYAGIFQVEHVLSCFECLVDLKKASQNQGSLGQLDMAPNPEEVLDLFMLADADPGDHKRLEAMQKAAGRFALVMLALKEVDRVKVKDYVKRNDIPEVMWQKMKKWSVFMAKTYPAPSKKVVGIEQMVEKYYEQLAIGIFTNVMLVGSQEVRMLMADALTKLLLVNQKRNGKGGVNKKDLLGLLRGIMAGVFEILKNTKKSK